LDPAPFAAQLAGPAVPGADLRAVDRAGHPGTEPEREHVRPRGLDLRRVLRGRLAAAAGRHHPAGTRDQGDARPGHGDRAGDTGAAGGHAGGRPARRNRRPGAEHLERRPARGTGQGHPGAGRRADLPALVRHELTPKDYLFLGAVSGLAFGASEVVHYFTVNGLAEFYLTVQSALPSIQPLILTGHSAPDSVFAVLIGPVRYFVLDFVWRFLTDPVTHACWAGLTGYFIGLAATGRHKWYTVSWIGLVIAAILHGLNDWSRVNGHWLWIVVTIVSGILFLGYAKVGSRSDLEVPDPWPPASGRHGLPPERPPATVGGGPRPWWEH